MSVKYVKSILYSVAVLRFLPCPFPPAVEAIAASLPDSAKKARFPQFKPIINTHLRSHRLAALRVGAPREKAPAEVREASLKLTRGGEGGGGGGSGASSLEES